MSPAGRKPASAALVSPRLSPRLAASSALEGSGRNGQARTRRAGTELHHAHAELQRAQSAEPDAQAGAGPRNESAAAAGPAGQAHRGEGDWDQWLNGSVEQAGALIRLPEDRVVRGEPEGGIGFAQKNLY